MTQGYRGRASRSSRVDMNWLNFWMPCVARRRPCPEMCSSEGSRQHEVGHAPPHSVPSVSRSANRVPKCAAPMGPGSTKWDTPRPAARVSVSHSAGMSRNVQRRGAWAARSGTCPAPQHARGVRTTPGGGRACDALHARRPRDPKVSGGVGRMPRGQSRSRSLSRRCGRSLRLAERPPPSRRRSISWPEMRVSARRPIVSLDRSAGSSTSEKS